jgi:exodeoxyribonuclease VIII
MNDIKPVFLVRRAKKSSGQPDAVLWCSDDFDAVSATLDYLLLKSGRKFKDYFKSVATNFPVVNELPPEGEISFTFCDYYHLGEDGMTWEQIPGVSLPSHPASNTSDQSGNTIVDGVDTSTGEIVDEQALNDAGSVPSTNTELKIGAGDDENTQYPIVKMSFRKQLLSQLTSDAHRYHLTQGEYHEIARLEMDTDNGYVQNLLLAATSVDKIHKLDIPFLWKYTKAVRDVFDMEKRHELSLVLKFTQVWAETSHLDRGLLVKEWAKGNRVSEINRTPSGANAGGGITSDRLTPLTKTGRDYEIALGLLAREYEFDIYAPSLEVDAKANAIMNLNWPGDGDVLDEYLATCKIFDDMPGGMDYSRACNVATVKTTPKGLWRDHGKHCEHLNRVMTETDHAHPDELVVDIACGRSSLPMPMAGTNEEQQPSTEEVDHQLAAGRGEFVPGISDPDDSKWVKTASNAGEKTEVETTSYVQVQNNNDNEEPAGDALSQSENAMQSGESRACAGEETITVEKSVAEILASAAPSLANQDLSDVNQNTGSDNQNSDSVSHTEQEEHQIAPEQSLDEPEQTWPTYFEPGRYEGVPNDVYHAANGLSSTQIKDARVSLMYFNVRHVAKTISQQDNPAFIFGRATHSFVLEPEKFSDNYALPEKMPEGVVSTTGEMVAIIKEYNATLPALMSPDELKAWIEEYNGNLTPPLSLSAGAEETANLYMSLPEEFQRIPAETKPTATAMKACIKEYNASLKPMLKTSGTRDQLLDQIATVAPEFAEQERAKFIPYNVSGTKEQLAEIVRTIRPDVVFADDWHEQQEAANAGKETISVEMYELIKNINDALQAYKDASRLLNHPARQSEVSYFGFDEETGLEVRVRPDIEIRLPYESICADLKTVSLGYVRQDKLKDRLHREIIDRDYHLSAAMYCDVAGLDKFTWIFVNKDPGYHWVAVVDASPMLLELGRKEYRRALRQIEEAMETGYWPAPITEAYTDDLNDYDTRRLEALDAE